MRRIGFDDEDPFRDFSDVLREEAAADTRSAGEKVKDLIAEGGSPAGRVVELKKDLYASNTATIDIEFTIHPPAGEGDPHVHRISGAPFGVIIAPMDASAEGMDLGDIDFDDLPEHASIIAFAGMHNRAQLIAAGCTMFATLEAEGVLGEVALRFAAEQLSRHSDSTAP